MLGLNVMVVSKCRIRIACRIQCLLWSCTSPEVVIARATCKWQILGSLRFTPVISIHLKSCTLDHDCKPWMLKWLSFIGLKFKGQSIFCLWLIKMVHAISSCYGVAHDTNVCSYERSYLYLWLNVVLKCMFTYLYWLKHCLNKLHQCWNLVLIKVESNHEQSFALYLEKSYISCTSIVARFIDLKIYYSCKWQRSRMQNNSRTKNNKCFE